MSHPTKTVVNFRNNWKEAIAQPVDNRDITIDIYNNNDICHGTINCIQYKDDKKINSNPGQF